MLTTFLEMTAIDFDMDIEDVKKIYKKDKRTMYFYRNLEAYIRERKMMGQK